MKIVVIIKIRHGITFSNYNIPVIRYDSTPELRQSQRLVYR
jgi:hypothetical protein